MTESGIRRLAKRKRYKLVRQGIASWSTARARSHRYTIKGTGTRQMYTLDSAEAFLRACEPRPTLPAQNLPAPEWAQALVDEAAERYPYVGRPRPKLVWKRRPWADTGANYNQRLNRINVYPTDHNSRGTLLHELSHWVMQDSPRMLLTLREILDGRREGHLAHSELFYEVAFELYGAFLPAAERDDAVKRELAYQPAAVQVAYRKGWISPETEVRLMARHLR